MVGDDDSDVLVLQFCDDVLDILNGDRVHTGERLIEKDELRVDGESTCNLATAALTSGELDTLALAHLVEVELVEKILKTLLSLLFGELLGHLHHRHNVVLNCHMAEHRSLLCKVAHTLLRALEHRELCNVLIIKEDLTVIWNDKSGDHIEAGRLSGTVRTEEAHNLSLLDFHRDTFHNRSGAIFLDQVFATKFH